MKDHKHPVRGPRPDSKPAAENIAGQGNMTSIEAVDLSLHGDGVSHWQDEPDGAADQKDGADDESQASRRNTEDGEQRRSRH